MSAMPCADKFVLVHCRQLVFAHGHHSDGLQFRVADFFVRVRADGFEDGDWKLVES